jgi:hypothetical protein
MTGATRHVDQAEYQIRIRGVLDPCWSDWLDGLTVTIMEGRDTILAGPVRDQAALHGLLAKIRDLNLVLVSVERIEREEKALRKKHTTALKATLLAIYLLVISALLMLAASHAYHLVRLYHGLSPQGAITDLNRLAGSQVRFLGVVLAPVLLATVLFLVTWRRPRRLLVASLLVLLAFAALNLYSGRHLLPHPLIPPRPSTLLADYAQALAAGDIEAALRLTDGSPECTGATLRAFSEHQTQLELRLGAGWEDKSIRSSPHWSITTYYEEAARWNGLLQPVPSQLFRLLVRTERGELAWLVGLRLRHKPFLGARYLCGQGKDPEGWRYR